jgi:hypothetical protein
MATLEPARDRPGGGPPVETVSALLKKTGATIECQLRGGSMGTSLPDGARLRLQFEQAPMLAVGDVVAFSAAGSITVHRIVGRGLFGPARSYLVTRGDGSVLTDHPVHVRTVVGVVREWRNGETWQPIPPCSLSGWRSVASRVVVGVVLTALHVQRHFAMAITVGGVVLRRIVGGARSV